VVAAGLKLLKEKVEKVATLGDLVSLSNLVNRKLEEIKPILEEDVKLERERLGREEKKWHEQTAKRRQDRERLLRHYTDILPLYIPCPKYTEAVLGTFLVKYDIEWAMVLGSQLTMVDKLDWEDDMIDLEPVSDEFLNITTSHPEERDNIVKVMEQRQLRILTSGDDDAVEAFSTWLKSKDAQVFVEDALKLIGIFGRLAQERYINIDELVKPLASPAKVPTRDKRSKS